jgi:hypothetical protein
MFDKMESKVKEIRKQPEHIRMKYVWICMGISMFIIIFIWLLTMKTTILNIDSPATSETSESFEELQQQIQNINKVKDSTNQRPVSIDELLQQNETNQ